MKQIMLLTSLLFAVFCGVQAQETYYEKHLIFPEKATAAQKLDMASRLIPTPQQLEWQQMEFTAFLHFGINTFTGREWGDGTEAPALNRRLTLCSSLSVKYKITDIYLSVSFAFA